MIPVDAILGMVVFLCSMELYCLKFRIDCFFFVVFFFFIFLILFFLSLLKAKFKVSE